MRGLAILSAAALVLVACGGGEARSPESAPRGGTAPFGGPLDNEYHRGDLYRVQGLVDDGGRISFGDAFDNVSDQPILVTDARFGVTKGVTVLGIMKLPAGVYGVGNPPGFPPRELRKHWAGTRPLVGSTLQPGEDVRIVIGLHLDAPNVGRVKNLTIEYELAGRRYRAADNDIFVARSQRFAEQARTTDDDVYEVVGVSYTRSSTVSTGFSPSADGGG